MARKQGLSGFALSALLTFAVQAQEMPKTASEAHAYEQADRLPVTAFYASPANLRATKPGDLLRQESFDGYSLPKGARAVRILYHSLSATGRDVATSAVVLVPAGDPPTGGWSYQVSGLMIEKGELAQPVTDVSLASDTLTMLRGVRAVGNDLRFDGSVCVPHLLIEEMALSGT